MIIKTTTSTRPENPNARQTKAPKGYLDITIRDMLDIKKVHKFNVRDGMCALRNFSEKYGITHRETLYIFGVVKNIPNKLPESTQD
jgi:hypothetical protein